MTAFSVLDQTKKGEEKEEEEEEKSSTYMDTFILMDLAHVTHDYIMQFGAAELAQLGLLVVFGSCAW